MLTFFVDWIFSSIICLGIYTSSGLPVFRGTETSGKASYHVDHEDWIEANAEDLISETVVELNLYFATVSETFRTYFLAGKHLHAQVSHSVFACLLTTHWYR